MASARFLLDNDDWKKVGTGLWIALAGALLAWGAAEFIPEMEKSADPKILMAAAILSSVVNILRKWLTDTRTTVT